MKLSIIDQCPVPAGFTTADAFRNTIELARLADRLGYERYWIAEHHATGAFASPAPEVLLARVGAETSHIRIGSGGVMLPHYSPMKVAESFRVLHALYPGRIDLGIGRAPGGSPLDSFALRRDRNSQQTEDDFPKQLLELIAFLHGGFRPDHAVSRIELSLAVPGAPEVWRRRSDCPTPSHTSSIPPTRAPRSSTIALTSNHRTNCQRPPRFLES